MTPFQDRLCQGGVVLAALGVIVFANMVESTPDALWGSAHYLGIFCGLLIVIFALLPFIFPAYGDPPNLRITRLYKAGKIRQIGQK